MDSNNEYESLRRKIDAIAQQQTLLKRQLDYVSEQLETAKYKLDYSKRYTPPDTVPTSPEPDETTDTLLQNKPQSSQQSGFGGGQQSAYSQQQASNQPTITKEQKPDWRDNIEKFIGENLISKLGIFIIIIGVVFGVNYAIDHSLISAIWRIIMAYLFSVALLGLAIRLKKSYIAFSAILLSGAMAILYISTYAAHDFYDLIPKYVSFALMAMFTVFTVLAAIKYNMQVIAHIGLVGAYSVPFLLSDGSGEVLMLLWYVLLIDVGVLVVAVQRYWKSLYYSASLITWLILFAWIAGADYAVEQHFATAMIFATVFFMLFYAVLLTYKLLKNEKYNQLDIVLLLANSFVYFAAGYMLLDGHEQAKYYLGLFTLANAIVHFGVSLVIFNRKLADKSLFYLVIGTVLTFITLAVPIQLDGNYVTLIWSAGALLIYWLGWRQKISYYQILATVLMVLAIASLLDDYSAYFNESIAVPVLNITMLSSLISMACLAAISYMSVEASKQSDYKASNMANASSVAMYVMLIVVSYFGFALEIYNYFQIEHQLSTVQQIAEYDDSTMIYVFDQAIELKSKIWLLMYSLVYVIALAKIVHSRIAQNNAGSMAVIASAIVVLATLTLGLYELSEMRYLYLQDTDIFERGAALNMYRYLVFAVLGTLLWQTYLLINAPFMKPTSKKTIRIILYSIALIVLSNELINIMQLAESTHSYKIEMSILWAVYSLTLVVIGIWQQQKELRIMAMALFGFTLLKVFLYDAAAMDTIAKTILFLSLGILLLIISFLYNKYTNKISNDNKQ